MKQHKTIADILSRPSFLCMSCDNETDYKFCDNCRKDNVQESYKAETLA